VLGGQSINLYGVCIEYVETLPSFSSVVVAALKPVSSPLRLCFSDSAVLSIECDLILPSLSYSEPKIQNSVHTH
jgi:hypothetical protein